MKKINKKKTEWYPVIDKDKCTSCLACVNFCTHGVYSIKDGKPKVENKNNCIEGCTSCEKICPVQAITHFGNNKETKESCCSGECDCKKGFDCK